MQGIFINGRRPKSKKAIREAVANGDRIRVEATSWHGNEPDGPITDLPVGTKVTFVGPDPYSDRRFYGTLTITPNGPKVA